MRGVAIQLNDGDGSNAALDLKFNVQRDASGKIISGLSIGDTVNQNQFLLLNMNHGELKEYPTVGVGVRDYILSEEFASLPSAVQESFTADRFKVDEVRIDKQQNLILKAHY